MRNASRRTSDWLALARSGIGAGRGLRANQQFGRSADSRFYFAGYAAVHATRLQRGSEPPVRGNWSHDALAEHLRATLVARTRVHRDRANRHLIDIVSLYNLRIIADDGASETLDADAVEQALHACARPVSRAERMVRG